MGMLSQSSYRFHMFSEVRPDAGGAKQGTPLCSGDDDEDERPRPWLRGAPRIRSQGQDRRPWLPNVLTPRALARDRAPGPAFLAPQTTSAGDCLDYTHSSAGSAQLRLWLALFTATSCQYGAC